MNIKEKLQADLDAAKQKVIDLEQQVANMPSEIENLAEEVYEKIKAFFKAL